MGEFELIRRYFASNQWSNIESPSQVLVPNGDDCAVLNPAPNHSLAISVDTLIAGVHFPLETSPEDIGHKALAVNLSDLAAMGAEPVWFTLALSLPESDPQWIDAFSKGLFEIASAHGCRLIGGDTTKGPLSITIQIAGQIANQEVGPLCRADAKVGDDIYVSGNLGEGAAGLKVAMGEIQPAEAPAMLDRLNRPSPRVQLGQALRGHANAAIDLSDGLLADLGHICEQSSSGADIWIDQLPTSNMLWQNFSRDTVFQMMLTGGDDYELCFTAPTLERSYIQKLAESLALPLTRVGQVTSTVGIRCLDGDGNLWSMNDKSHGGESRPGYDHFG